MFSKMPAAVAEKSDKQEHMWTALRQHILRERERKKQEREAEVEEERQRKEREAREQQDVMTLGETREQISQLEAKLTQLKEEKHQLFLQLKKVLNEDDNRRRQQVKESSEIMMQQLNPGLVHQPLYLPQAVPRPLTIPQPGFKTTTKRPRSPSPPPTAPVTMYHTTYGYKQGQTFANTSYQSPQKDDGRRHELVRAVLWNKTPQYPNQAGSIYPPFSELQISYYQQGLPPREAPRAYDSSRSQYHLDQKAIEHYALRPPTSHGHVIQGATIPIAPAQPPSKTGSITAGYPVRTQYQQTPPPGSVAYTNQSRTLYQSPPTGLSYPPRD